MAAITGVNADDLGAAPACAAELGVLCPLAGLPQPAVAALAAAVGLPDWGAAPASALPEPQQAPRVMLQQPQQWPRGAGRALAGAAC